jgi:hypothetical protein
MLFNHEKFQYILPSYTFSSVAEPYQINATTAQGQEKDAALASQ